MQNFRIPTICQHKEIHYVFGCLLYSMLLINTSSPSAAYMRQWTGSALVQVMACRLFGVKPLPEPMLPYCQLGPLEQTSVKFESKDRSFYSINCTWICPLRVTLSRGDELSIVLHYLPERPVSRAFPFSSVGRSSRTISPSSSFFANHLLQTNQ